MMVWKRIAAGLILLLAAAVFFLALAGSVGVWIVKGPVTERATRVFERIDAALDVADKGLKHVKTSLVRAAKHLDGVRAEQRELARQPQPNNARRRTMARTVQRTVAPDLASTHEKLQTAAEAAAVVNSVLEDMRTFPFLSASRLDVAPLTEINSRLSAVESSAWELSRLLSEPQPDSAPDAVTPQLSQVDQALKRMGVLIDDYEPRLTQVRQRAEQLKSRTFAWITPASVLVSLGCFWIALSQVSVLAHAWSWSRRSCSDNSRP
jgi:hypothetical protein